MKSCVCACNQALTAPPCSAAAADVSSSFVAAEHEARQRVTVALCNRYEALSCDEDEEGNVVEQCAGGTVAQEPPSVFDNPVPCGCDAYGHQTATEVMRKGGNADVEERKEAAGGR